MFSRLHFMHRFICICLFLLSGIAFSTVTLAQSSSSSSSSGGIRQCNLDGEPVDRVTCANADYWNPSASYEETAEVQFGDSLFRAKWANSNVSPEEEWGAWEKVKACNWMCKPIYFPGLKGRCGPTASRAWQSDGLYPPGVQVWREDKIYVSISCSASKDPVTSEAQWQYVEDCTMVPPPTASSSGSSSSTTTSSSSGASFSSSSSTSSGGVFLQASSSSSSTSSSGYPMVSQYREVSVQTDPISYTGLALGASVSVKGYGYPDIYTIPMLISENGSAGFSYIGGTGYHTDFVSYIGGGRGQYTSFDRPGYYRYRGGMLWKFVEVLNPYTCSAEPHACAGIPAWEASKVYLAGDAVMFGGEKYVAKWWTQYQEPATNTQEWGPWRKTACEAL